MTMQGLSMSVANAIYHRHSSRAFTPQLVDQESLKELLAAAVRAPTARHEEPWGFVIVQEKALLAHIAEVCQQQLQERGASLPGSMEHSASENAAADVFHGAGTLILICANSTLTFGAADCWLAAANLMLMAHAMGLGSCVIGSALAAVNTPGLRSDLGIAPELATYAAIVLGYPHHQEPATPRRPPLILRHFHAPGAD